jgi:hypothetical protein
MWTRKSIAPESASFMWTHSRVGCRPVPVMCGSGGSRVEWGRVCGGIAPVIGQSRPIHGCLISLEPVSPPPGRGSNFARAAARPPPWRVAARCSRTAATSLRSDSPLAIFGSTSMDPDPALSIFGSTSMGPAPATARADSPSMRPGRALGTGQPAATRAPHPFGYPAPPPVWVAATLGSRQRAAVGRAPGPPLSTVNHGRRAMRGGDRLGGKRDANQSLRIPVWRHVRAYRSVPIPTEGVVHPYTLWLHTLGRLKP